MSGDQTLGIAHWLAMRGLEKYTPVFEANDIDVETLPSLSHENLREIGLPMGGRLKILKAVAEDFNAAPKPSLTANQEVLEALAQVVTERRQVTAMFCDIVRSTQIAAAMDPEDIRLLLLGYWRVIEETTARFHGYIAQHLGDGALIYFGFPLAREDDAEQAILAGLALLKGMPGVGQGSAEKLQIRIGVATGTVVINQFKGREGTVETLAIGQTVNLASRLQSLAVPGSLVIDEPTMELVQGLFTIEPQEEVAIEGFDGPATLYKVSGAKPVKSRFEAKRRGAQSEYLGRETQLDRAMACWRVARGGNGQLLLVQGEPGIGKSHLVWELMARMSAEPFERVDLQCSPHNASSPLFPLIDGLSRMADATPANTPEETKEKAKALFGSSVENHILLLDLFDPDSARPGGDPQQRRLQTLSALVEFFAAKCATTPLLLVVEDLHWCDPTTLEFLDRLLFRARSLPVMIVTTSRPEFQHDFGGGEHVTALQLARLERSDTDALVREIFGTPNVSARLLDIVAERTDGVPLFVDELVKSLDESGAIVRLASGIGFNEATGAGAIPRSLQSILTARIDKLRGAKRIAQIAACIGREFSLNLLARVAQLPEVDLRAALAEIAASELIFNVGHEQFEEFSFRHALVRDAAYSSLLYSERQTIHKSIAEALAGAEIQARPEILAHHLTGAHLFVPAIAKWCEAGEAAKLRSADAEAIEHLRQALGLVEQLPQDPSRDERELEVLLALIAPLRAAKGFAATDVAALTARAIALADKAKDALRILPLLYNRWVYNFVTSHRNMCETLARDILDRSVYDGTNLLRMTGLRLLAAKQFTAGEFREAAENFDASIALYGLSSQSDLTHAVGLDGKVTALGYNSLTRWCLGDRDRARTHIRDALSHAGVISHMSTTAFVTYHETLLAGVLERNLSVLKANGRKLEDIGREHRFEMWLICGKLLESLGACLEEPVSGRIDAAEAHFADFEDMGVVYRPTFEVLLAESCLKLGDRDRGLAHIESAKSLIEKTGERWNESEVYRLEGELTADEALAGLCFSRAISIANTQNASILEARARKSASYLTELTQV